MVSGNGRILLVGDNPFHRISHFSQDRTRLREEALERPERAADLVMCSLESGADGFMFSVSETTLSILNVLSRRNTVGHLSLYAIVPYAYEYVRLAARTGGVPGLAKNLAKQVVFSGDIKAAFYGLKGLTTADPVSLLKAYLAYELGRIKSSIDGVRVSLHSVLLHEIITDMSLALNLDWLIKAYVEFMLGHEMTPGFNTCNFAYLVNKFREWNIELGKTVVAAPFNKVGFQMNPSRGECEKALGIVGGSEVIAISILAAGYLSPQEAASYVSSLPEIKGVAVGVSRDKHARETFRLLKENI